MCCARVAGLAGGGDGVAVEGSPPWRVSREPLAGRPRSEATRGALRPCTPRLPVAHAQHPSCVALGARCPPPALTISRAAALTPYLIAPPPSSSPPPPVAIIAVRREVFGIVEGNGKRSGRKVLRRNLYGPAVRSYYPLTMADLELHKVGVFSPAAEDKYR